MRENATFLEKLSFSYVKPLLTSSRAQDIKLEQYGDLPERLSISTEEKKLEVAIQKYIKKDPTDRFAFMKGIIEVNKSQLIKFLVVRMLLQADDIIMPWVAYEMVGWLTTKEDENSATAMYMFGLCLLVPLIRCTVHTTWEYFCFQMIEMGHLTHTALKVMLFRKNFKMTTATNKDFSSGEINNIVMNESGRIWSFIWEGPAYFECFFHLITASITVFYQIGWCGFMVLFFTGSRILL